jgi:hypothetical protein
MGSKVPFKHGARPVDIFDLDDRNIRKAQLKEDSE